MVNHHSDSERGNPLPPHGLLFPISSKGSFICTIPWGHPMKDRSDDLRSYISLPARMRTNCQVKYIPSDRFFVVFIYLFIYLSSYLDQFSSVRFLTCTFRASCYSTRLSWAHTPVINWAVCLGQKVSS